MKPTIGIVAAIAAVLVSHLAAAQECKPTPGVRQPVDAIMKNLLQQGYQRVLSIEIRISNCYDAVVIDKSGKKVELDVDPVTMKAVAAGPQD